MQFQLTSPKFEIIKVLKKSRAKFAQGGHVGDIITIKETVESKFGTSRVAEYAVYINDRLTGHVTSGKFTSVMTVDGVDNIPGEPEYFPGVFLVKPL